MRAKYLLTTVKTDSDYKHGYYFKNDTERRATIIGNSSFSDDEINFNRGSILATQCVVNEYNNENYMVINYDGNLFYYFITSVSYLSVTQWRLSLELDVITQYVTGLTSTHVSNCLIHRAHVDRWINNGNNTVSFNLSSNSPLIQSEIDFNMYPTSRNEARIKYSDNSRINEWLNNNIVCWCYIYVDATHAYNWMGTNVLAPYEYASRVAKSTYVIGHSELEEEYGCICVPIYSGAPRMMMVDRPNKICGVIDSASNFRSYNSSTNEQYIYNIKYSLLPPVIFDYLTDAITFDEDNWMHINISTKTSPDDPNKHQGWGVMGTPYYGSLLDVRSVGESATVRFIDDVMYTDRPGNVFANVGTLTATMESVGVGGEFTFDISRLYGLRDMTLEPKLLLDCKQIVIRDSSNGEYIYNPLWMGTNVVTPYYDEMLNITNTNYYYRLKSEGLYDKSEQDNWHGVANTINMSQQIVNDNYANFIANNKNFLLSRALDLVPSMIIGTISGGYGSLLSGVMGSIATKMDIDNINNKPNSLRNAGNTGELLMKVNNGIKLYVDIERCRDVDRDNYYEYLYRYGYKLEKIDNPFNYIGTRLMFNYIQCDMDYIGISAPVNVENKIKNIFRNGITLWNNHGAIYDYTRENRELNIR